ncbi:Uncharacterized protein C9.08c [Hypsizygus marmoreus]|uniref:Uncharacterized protein C9.08c n=1 Tax=Hypsizygus marmoreus TaxID=39966 RepID=A0A369J4F3_HYPMA|nr:Uncharacterized protein C9.08c [Hypsizygus marmoreus]
MLTQAQATLLYNGARKWFMLSSLGLLPVLLVIDAPFGRFTPSGDSLFLVDGIKSWMAMELVSPILFIYTFVKSPLSYFTPDLPLLLSPQGLLFGLYLIHYLNRAIFSPLRTPSRSKSHIIVPLAAVFFNAINGSLMGAYLSSPYARIFLPLDFTLAPPSFYIGLILWGLGFAGNILHDEILLDIRRKAKSKGKGKASSEPGERVQEHYAIPQGWLYSYVSYPNYLCEWIEWFGFALAAAPFPLDISTLSWEFLSPAAVASVFSWPSLMSLLSNPAYLFAPNLAPPYIFLLSEVLLMLPRAIRGHQWYRQKFGEQYPKDRKAVVPFLL